LNALWLATVALLVGFAAPDRLAAEERKALVIGNAEYGKGDLANPVNDAEAVAKALKKVGFKVTLKKNLGEKGIRKAVSTFAGSLGAGDVALFFYAGHGIEIGGQNYLLGVDFSADNEVDAEDEAYKMGTMLKHLSKRQGGLNIVIIDACRDDPYSRSWGRTGKGRGLAVVERIPPSTLIAFSAKPGQVASDGGGKKNSPFTKALVQHLSTPGLELSKLFMQVRVDVQKETSQKQFPMVWDLRLTEFFFRAPTARPVVTPSAAVVATKSFPAPVVTTPSPAPGGGTPSAAPVVTTTSPAHGTSLSSIEWVWSDPAGLYFARTETTVAQYAECVEAGSCAAEHHKRKSDWRYCNLGYADRDNHPMNCVDWYGAQAFCEWAGGRLPTEKEWYVEASHGGSREFSWGDREVTCSFAVWGGGDAADGCGSDSTSPACSRPAGKSVSGLCDMSGNVWEWTASWYDEDRDSRVLRGGDWGSGPRAVRASYRSRRGPGNRGDGYGFRCVRSSQ